MALERVVSREEAARQARRWQQQGRVVVFTNGVFDLLHPGHVLFLERARNLGDVLVVGVNTDASVRRLKGPHRPIYPLEARLILLHALRSVDLLVPFDEDTPERLIQAVRPQVLVKGADYRPDQVVGRAFVESYGGRVVLLPLVPGYSTSKIIERIRQRP